MKKVMVFNFRTMRFEQATEAEGKEWLSLIEANNAECAAQHHMHLTPGSLRTYKQFPRLSLILRPSLSENAPGAGNVTS